jgi:RNA polymerase sigma-70 factor (ECF subfamily)
MTTHPIYNTSPSDWTDTVADSASEAARQCALDTFLAGVERRAFVIAELATRNPDDALDLVQDAMLAFVASYGNKPQPEWPPLFHRVLQNRIRDWHRRQGVRNRWRVWLRGTNPECSEEAQADPLQQARDPAGRTPEELAALQDAGDALLEAVASLPQRQQQAFVLRTWEALDVADTARVMGCSSGSVKTHLSRAMASLRDKLKGHW